MAVASHFCTAASYAGPMAIIKAISSLLSVTYGPFLVDGHITPSIGTAIYSNSQAALPMALIWAA